MQSLAPAFHVHIRHPSRWQPDGGQYRSALAISPSRPVVLVWGFVFPRNHQSHALLVVLGTTSPLSRTPPCIYRPSLCLHLYPYDSLSDGILLF